MGQKISQNYRCCRLTQSALLWGPLSSRGPGQLPALPSTCCYARDIFLLLHELLAIILLSIIYCDSPRFSESGWGLCGDMSTGFTGSDRAKQTGGGAGAGDVGGLVGMTLEEGEDMNPGCTASTSLWESHMNWANKSGTANIPDRHVTRRQSW